MKPRRTKLISKLVKTTIILKDRELAQYVPKTVPMSSKGLASMLTQYGMVYIKPTIGALGIGVMRVERFGNEGYRYQSGKAKYAFSSFASMYASIRRRVGAKPYLVQRGIYLLKHLDRPFDFRVMVQRNPRGQWECTGTVARLAHPKKIVTNGSQGGTIYPSAQLLRYAAGTKKAAQVIRRMESISLQTARLLSKSDPTLHVFGLDIAIDRQLRPWMLEVNTNPDPCPFTKVQDASMLRKILRYAKAHGQTYTLHCIKARKAPAT
ncbi:YheC/YheD family protein [Paenibacillus methanolicus]|uniref:YheC/D-like protein n=1 Tax=Paenibacillus methanolicus TaxID=582686 RepID=A0A5S5CDP8_9BACL|nr:YheC/YheD family protein [Paenibacillus methanolicus]TYP76622.1 YheC/D-like protein [Paenibacillus methanolicus]